MEQKRGQLTDRIKKKSKELMGSEINVTELRLMPYILHVMMNEQRLERHKINADERKIISAWRSKGYIEGGMGRMRITEEFWNIICEIVRLGYVDLSA